MATLSEEIAQTHRLSSSQTLYLGNMMRSRSDDGAYCCPKVAPQSAAKTIRIILDCYMYGPVRQFLLRV